MTKIGRIPSLVSRLYEIVDELEQIFPDRRFTLDGHLLGSIGEVLAAYHYGLQLLQSSAKGHDATAGDGRLVQIKVTQRTSVGLRSRPDHLLVLKLVSTGIAREIYNGPGANAWNSAGKMQKNGQRPISVSRLVGLMKGVDTQNQLERVVPIRPLI